MKLGKVLDKVLGQPLPAGKRPDKSLPLADKELCQSCGVRAAWKTLRASLSFKDDEPTRKVLEHMDSLENQYKFKVD